MSKPIYRRFTRRDTSEKPIIAFLKAAGWSVMQVNVRDGPDLFVSKSGVTIAVECKTGKAKQEPGQKQWMERWQGTAFVLRDVADAEALNRAAMPATRFGQQSKGA